MNVIFLGPPGVGKGTMAARTQEFLGIPHVSTGVLFRENVAKRTPLGIRIKEIMERGDLVPDELTVSVVKDRLGLPDAGAGFILDGFPRTIVQAQELSRIGRIDCVINLTCPSDVLVRRLTGRRFCPQCGRIYHVDFMPPLTADRCDDDDAPLSIRDDDRVEAVVNRLKVYTDLTAPLIDWYRQKGLLREVNASAVPDEVFDAVRAVLEMSTGREDSSRQI